MTKKLLIRLTVAVIAAFAIVTAVSAQTWGIYNNLDGHVSITRTAEGAYWRWTYTFWHGNQAVPNDPVYQVSVRFLTLDDGGVDSIKTGSEHYWDYTGRWETGSGPGTNPYDYVWNGDWTTITDISEVPSGGVSAGIWRIGSANQGEYRRIEVSFLTDLPNVGKNYLDIFGDIGISHAVIGEVPAVPEPASLVSMLLGASGVVSMFRLRKKA